jgi:hypothetical protein
MGRYAYFSGLDGVILPHYTTRLTRVVSLQALIALNDDIVKEAYVRIVDTYLDNWHNRMWPNRTIYEVAPVEVALEE